jgi:hypothetical protein
MDETLDWDLRIDIESNTAPGSGEGDLSARIERGLYLSGYDIDNLTFIGSKNRTGNVTSGIIHNTSNNITSARLKWNEIIVQNASASKKFLGSAELSNSSLFSIQAWLSADNGTNWESTLNDVVHVFDSPGKALKYRFIYAIRDNSGVFQPLVSGVRVFVTPENLQNFTINIDEESGEKEFNVSNLNTTQLFTHSGNAVLNACNATSFQGACNVTILFTSDTGGLLTVNSLNYTHNFNPLEFFEGDDLFRFWESDSTPNVTVNFTNGNVSLSGLDLRYWGDGNVTVNATVVGSSILASRIVINRFSRFLISSLKPWFDIVAQTPNDKNVEPFGQRAKFNESIFNVTSSVNNTDNMNLSFQLNKSVDSCVVLFGSNESDKTPTYVLPNNITPIFPAAYENMTLGDNRQIFVWANLTDCNASLFRVFDPYNFWNSFCVGCVINDLNNLTVFV